VTVVSSVTDAPTFGSHLHGVTVTCVVKPWPRTNVVNENGTVGVGTLFPAAK
jgi:hypothetical protein